MYQSSFTTTDSSDELSVHYKNLYILNNVIYYFTTENIELPIVNIWTNYYSWRPVIKLFNSDEELKNFVISNFEKAITIENGVYGGIVWSHNIGHGLFDGLYPSYLSLVKFGKWHEDFTFITNDWDDAQKNMTHGVVEAFSRSSILELNKTNNNYIVKNFFCGTGRTGIRVMREDYTLYGKKYEGIRHFRKRIFETYGLNSDLPTNKDNPKIIIIDNIRYTVEDRVEIDKAIYHYKKLGYNIEYLYWYNYKTFSEQMKRFEDVDIQVSAPGTGMNYSPFLKRGAVSVNLGCIKYFPNDLTKPLPAYMEQAVGAGQDEISTIFYDRSNHLTLISEELIKKIDEAISLIKNSVVLTNNLNIDAQIYVEYCKRVSNARHISDHLTGMAYFIEYFVNNYPNANPENIVDLKLLEDIKKQFNYKMLF